MREARGWDGVHVCTGDLCMYGKEVKQEGVRRPIKKPTTFMTNAIRLKSPSCERFASDPKDVLCVTVRASPSSYTTQPL